MPCLEVSMPTVSHDVRARLAEALTVAFAEHSGMPADIFGIRFLEYGHGKAASGGRLCSEDDERPYLHMLLYSPRLSRSVKQRLGRGLTQAFVSAVSKDSWTPVIHICEHPYDNVVVDGQLLADAYPQLADQAFYFSLEDLE